MKLADWPQADRQAWKAALRPFDPFDPNSGSHACHRLHSRRKIEKGYGRWLTWASSQGILDEQPAARITPERVAAYVRHLDSLGNARHSILSRLQELDSMARILARDTDWRFIRAIASRIRSRRAGPDRRRARLVGSQDLLRLGLQLMAEADHARTPRLAAMAFRDGLLIALLALRPLRRKNLAGLQLGRSLLRMSDGWHIVFEAEEMKNGQPLDLPWPDLLVEPLEIYLTAHRPVLAALQGHWRATIGDHLWVSAHGSPMTEMALYQQIRSRSLEGLGKAINPHLFRHAAATSLAIADPEHVRMASTLLSHATPATTERYYQMAQSLSAHRRYAAQILRAGDDP